MDPELTRVASHCESYYRGEAGLTSWHRDDLPLKMQAVFVECEGWEPCRSALRLGGQ